MRLTLRQLEVFAAVCREGSVTGAAARVNLSQSSASQALAELEAGLDGPLFDRVGRRLQLNERGAALKPAAFELLDRAQDIEHRLRGHAELPPPQVRIAASLTVGSYLLPQFLGDFLAREPQAHIELVVRNTEQVIEEVAAFRADAGFIEGQCRHPELSVRRWREDRLIVVAAPQNPLARRRKIAIKDLAASRWVLRERGSGTREVFERAAAAAGFSPLAALELGHSEAVMRAVAAGAGLGCLSEVAVRGPLQRRELVALRCSVLDLQRPLYLLLHREKYLSQGLRRVLQACGASPDAQHAEAGSGAP
jgi:DNA-binding transcriptional LysR family regulator